MPDGLPNHYQRLGVDVHASMADIRAAFRAMAKTAHPDAGGDPEAFRLLKEAFDILTSGHDRREYDASLEAPEHQPVRVNKVTGWSGPEGDFTGSVVWPDYLQGLVNEPWRRGDEPDTTLIGDADVLWSCAIGVDRIPLLTDGQAVLTAGAEITSCDLASGVPAWRCDLGAPAAADPILVDDLVIAVSQGSDVQAFDHRRGVLAWRARLKEPPTALAGWSGSVAVAAGRRVVILRTDTGKQHDAIRTSGPALSLLVDDGLLVAHTTADTLEGFDTRKGRPRFVIRDVPVLHVPPVVAAGQVWLVGADGRMIGIDPAAGRVVVTLAPGARVAGAVGDSPRSLLYATIEDPTEVLAVTSGGHVRWSAGLPDPAFAPALDDEHLHVVTEARQLLTFDRSAGKLLSCAGLQPWPFGAPVARGGRVIVRDGDGTVWAVKPPSPAPRPT